MTTEDDFQNALDANPDDHHTRLVFADWLEEHGDVRAEGFRALGLLRKRPYEYGESGGVPANGPFYYGGNQNMKDDIAHGFAILQRDWHEKLAGFKEDTGVMWSSFRTRREADEAAALSFSQLSPDVRSQILKGKT